MTTRMPTKAEAEVLAWLILESDKALMYVDLYDMPGFQAREDELCEAARSCDREGWLQWVGLHEYPNEGDWRPTEMGRVALWRARRNGVLPPRIYLSGPMSGQPDRGRPVFAEATARLRAAGFEVVNPAEHQGPVDGKQWHEYLRFDLKLLVDCDAVAVLPGWQESKGAALEVHAARALRMEVREVDIGIKTAGVFLGHAGQVAL